MKWKRGNHRSSRGRTARRKSRIEGNFLAEVPGVIFVLFFLLVVPLINMGSIGISYGGLLYAAREGAHAAATSPTFSTIVNNRIPANVAGPREAGFIAARYPTVTVQSTNVDIIETNVSNGSSTRYSTKLPQAADTTKYVYSLEVTITANVRPLMAYSMFGEIVGVKVSASEFSEAPDGLSE